MQSDHVTNLRHLHRRDGAVAGFSGARGSSAFVGGGSRLVDFVPIAVVNAGKGGGDDRRVEVDPKGKNGTQNAVSVRRRDIWRCIFAKETI